MKKIRINESQYKRVISNVVNEIIKEDASITKDGRNKLTINVDGNWNAGYYSMKNLPNEVLTEIQNMRNSINNFILDNSGYIIKFTIEVGESQITNYDNEVTPKKPLSKGDLSKKRGESLKTYFTKYYQGLVDSGTIKSLPQFETKQTIGSTPYSREEYSRYCEPNKRDSQECKNFFEKYKSEQFVKIFVEAISDGGCIADFIVHIGYIWEQAKKAGRPPHTCNLGVFDVLLNGVRLGTANINNGGNEWKNDKLTGGKIVPEEYPTQNSNEWKKSARWPAGPKNYGDNRMYYFKLNPELAKKVAAANPNEISIKIKGLLKNNHNDVPFISVGHLVDGKPKYIYSGVPIDDNKRTEGLEKELGALDPCGLRVIRGFNM